MHEIPHLDDLDVSPHGRPVEGRVVPQVHRADLRALREQVLDDLGVAFGGGGEGERESQEQKEAGRLGVSSKQRT